MHLKNVTLELSSKPFTDESEATMVSVCRKMFTQWQDLIRTADQVSVMLWIADLKGEGDDENAADGK